MSYIDGFVLPVPEQNRAAYLELAKKASRIFRKHGALRVVEAWGDDLQVGKVNDFRTAVIAEQGEQVVFSWIEWPSKTVRDAGMAAAMKDPEMDPPDLATMPFAGERLIWGGFEPLLDTQGD